MSDTTPGSTRDAERRTLRFESLADVLADAEHVLSGPHRVTGNWSAAEIVGHVGDLLGIGNGTLDVAPLPLPLRMFGRILHKVGATRRPIKAGIKAPDFVDEALAAHRAAGEDGALAHLREQTRIAESPAGLTKPSPLFGRLSRAEWITLHCRHAELHFSFLHPDSDAG